MLIDAQGGERGSQASKPGNVGGSNGSLNEQQGALRWVGLVDAVESLADQGNGLVREPIT